MSNPKSCNKVGVKISEETLSSFSSSITVSTSGHSIGSEWVLETISNVFHLQKAFDFRSMGPEKALLITADMIARQQILTAGIILEMGAKIGFTPWNSSKHTIESMWFTKEICVNVIGLPHHLWTAKNVDIIGKAVWEDYVEGEECLQFLKLNMLTEN